MKKRIPIMVAAAFLAVAASSPAEVTIEPAGLKIVWKPLKEEFDGFSTFNSQAGTSVCLALKAGDKSIIAFDKDKSKVAMTNGANELGGKFGSWNKISKDGKVMRVEVNGEKLPADTQSAIHLKGEVLITVASKSETKASPVKSFVKGDMVTITDDFKFEISRIEKPKWGNDPLAITLKWKKKIPELAAVRFYDGEGKLIESKAGSSSWGGFLGSYTVTKSYNLKKKPKGLKIEVDLWVDAEDVKVPVDLKVGVTGAN